MPKDGPPFKMSKLYHHFIHRGDRGVLYLHGFMGRSEEMHPVVSPRASALLVDLPGHGRNLDPELLNWEAFITHLHQLLQALPIREWFFYGYSMGGRLILEYLKKNNAPYSLILESVSPGFGFDEKRKLNDEILAQQMESLPPHQVKDFIHQWYAKDLFTGMNSHPCYPHYINQKDIANYKNWALALRAFSVSSQSSCLETLKDIQGIYLCGKKDHRYIQLGKIFKQKLNFQLHCFAHASHNVHFFYPQHIKQLLNDTLAIP